MTEHRTRSCGPAEVEPQIRADWATIEHLDHLPPFQFREGQTADDFAIACWRCNCNLRGAKPLWVFVGEQGIADTVAPVIKAWLNRAKGDAAIAA